MTTLKVSIGFLLALAGKPSWCALLAPMAPCASLTELFLSSGHVLCRYWKACPALVRKGKSSLTNKISIYLDCKREEKVITWEPTETTE